MKTKTSTQRRKGAKSEAGGQKPEKTSDYDLLAIQLFRIGRAAAGLVDPRFKDQEWPNLLPAVAEGWLAVGRHVFFNYDLKLVAGWKAVSVEMPDDEIMVLIHGPKSESDPVWFGFHDGDGWHYADTSRVNTDVTHWMHLPEPPNLKGGGK